MMRAVSIGILVAIGAYWGRRIAILFGFCLLLTTPLNAQLWFGDTAWVHENRDSRGYFFVDTAESIGWYKFKDGKPWVYELPHSIEYRDWWFETASCQNMLTSPVEFYRWRFFVVNRETFGGKGPLQIGYAGYTLPDSQAIYIAAPNVHNKGTLMHEITHALMWMRHEKPGHSWKRFGAFGCGFRYVTFEDADKEK